MTPSILFHPAVAHDASSSGSASPGATTKVDKNMFMQLMVAQLRNQDPLNPTDSAQFLTQLAQFQQLEQSVNSGADLQAIRTDLDQLVAAQGSGNSKS